MKMLWSKETRSSSSDAIYANILRELKVCKATKTPETMKKDTISDLTERFRLKADLLFCDDSYEHAMDNYNRSLCFAEKDSELMTKAYANRSACFFSMNMHKKCLVDIELAEKGNCPDQKRINLEQRRAVCMQLIGNSNFTADVAPFAIPQLSFESNAKIPYMVNLLDLAYNKELDIHIVAKRNIDVGKTIIVEPFYIYVPGADKSLCSVCGKSEPSNLIPCDSCSDTMFCSEECRQNSHHEIECTNGIFERDDTEEIRTIMFKFVVRTIAKAFHIFNSVTEFIAFVAQCIENRTIVPSLDGDRSKYEAFLKVLRHKDYVRKCFCVDAVSFAHQFLMKSDLGKHFVTEAQQNFLAHLIWHHLSIGLLINENRWQGMQQLDSSLTLTPAFLSFSCTPNAVVYYVNGSRVVTTVRPIESGEPIFITRLGDHTTVYKKPVQVDEVFSTTQRIVICKCDRCKQRMASPAVRHLMCEDSNFRLVVQNRSKKRIDSSENERLKENAIQFLRKFGRSIWCLEIGLAVDCLEKCINFPFRKEKREEKSFAMYEKTFWNNELRHLSST